MNKWVRGKNRKSGYDALADENTVEGILMNKRQFIEMKGRIFTYVEPADLVFFPFSGDIDKEIGRASCRERVCHRV